MMYVRRFIRQGYKRTLQTYDKKSNTQTFSQKNFNSISWFKEKYFKNLFAYSNENVTFASY